MRLRQNVKDLTAAQKQAFVNAVVALKKKPSILHPADPKRSRYDDYPEVHMNAMMAQSGSPNSATFKPGWAHNAPAFFPWHRVMILAFENDLAAIDPTVTLPYWDWPDAASSPFTLDFLGTNGDAADSSKVKDGPFAAGGPNQWTLNVVDNPGDPTFLQRDFGDALNMAMALPTGNQVSNVLGQTPYEKSPFHGGDGSFRSRCETELHNLVHRWVGGTMLGMTSPNDPVFFLHHCNIDRLWWMWQKAHAGDAPYLPVSGAAMGHNLDDSMIFNMGGTAPFPGTFAPSDVIDNLALGYTYDPAQAHQIPGAHITATAVAKILFGIINDAPGAWIDGAGHIHHGGGGPGDPGWSRMSSAVKDDLIGRAIVQLSALATNAAAKADVAKAAKGLVAKAHAAKV